MGDFNDKTVAKKLQRKGVSCKTYKDFDSEAWSKAFAYCDAHINEYGILAKCGRMVGANRKHFKKRYAKRVTENRKPGPPPRLGYSVEEKLVQWICEYALMGNCLTKSDIMAKATQLGGIMGVTVGSNTWYKLFRQRFISTLVTRNPQAIEKIRLVACNSVDVAVMMEDIGKLVEKFGPDGIYNMDETGFSLRNFGSKVSCKRCMYINNSHTNKHTYRYIYIYIFMYTIYLCAYMYNFAGGYPKK